MRMLALDQDSLERRSLARNGVLFRQGDKVTAIYFIEEGRLRLERRTFDGRLLFLGTTPAGEFFVAAALFSDTFHCDAVATEPSRVRVYPKAMVLNSLRTDPASAMSFLAHVAHQIIELRQRVELMKVRSAKERLMLYFESTAELGRTHGQAARPGSGYRERSGPDPRGSVSDPCQPRARGRDRTCGSPHPAEEIRWPTLGAQILDERRDSQKHSSPRDECHAASNCLDIREARCIG